MTFKLRTQKEKKTHKTKSELKTSEKRSSNKKGNLCCFTLTMNRNDECIFGIRSALAFGICVCILSVQRHVAGAEITRNETKP